MSRENVDVVRKCFDAYVRGDYEEASACLAPDIVWEIDQELPALGPAAVRAVWARWDSDWETLEAVAEEYLDEGDGVLMAVRYRGRGRASGVEVAMRVFEVHTLKDGRCVHKRDYRERSEALEALRAARGRG